jgi:amino-acid N-acetyltransferase
MIPGLDTRPPLADALTLLDACGLPVDDISEDRSPRFLAVRREGHVVATVALEYHGHEGLVRSLAVAPDYRGKGIATDLLAFAESLAYAHDVDDLYLLTDSASGFFEKQDYAPLDRPEAPPTIAQTPQFTTLCPSSATLMRKSLGGDAPAFGVGYRPPGGSSANF